MDSGSTTELGAGSPFGTLRIVRRIAIGGTAEVFLAEAADGARVVLKVPFEGGGDDAERNAAIEREAAIGARLAHPSIVRVLGTERHGSRVGLVQEFVDGVPLEALLRGRPLAPGVAIRLVVALAEALEVAHRATDARGESLGLVHRDLSPRNVLVDRDGAPRLLDFGIARSTLASPRTRTGALKGTLRYLAPEQATSSELDPRTDVYGLGLLGFEMLEGEPYLLGGSDVELLRAAEDPAPRPIEADVPDAAKDAIGRALRRFPEERFASALALAKRLEPFAGDPAEVRAALAAEVDALLPARTIAPPRPIAAERGRFARMIPRALGMVVAVVVVVGIGLRTRDDAPADPPRPSATVAILPATTPSATSPSATERGALAARSAPDAPTTTRTSPPDAPASRPTRPPSPTATATAIATGTAAPAEVPAEPPPESTSVAGTVAGPSAIPDDAPSPTRASIRAKIARADAALREARARGADVARAEALSREALAAYVEARYADADRLLDRILASSPSP